MNIDADGGANGTEIEEGSDDAGEGQTDGGANGTEDEGK